MNRQTTCALLLMGALMLGANPFVTFPLLADAKAQAEERVPGVLRAQSIELVDGKGNVVAQLYVGEDGGGNLRLRSGDGTVRVKLGATADGSGLLLLDAAVEPAIWLGADESGTRLTLSEKGKGKRVITP